MISKIIDSYKNQPQAVAHSNEPCNCCHRDPSVDALIFSKCDGVQHCQILFKTHTGLHNGSGSPADADEKVSYFVTNHGRKFDIDEVYKALNGKKQLQYCDVQWEDQVGIDVPMEIHPEAPAVDRQSNDEAQN